MLFWIILNLYLLRSSLLFDRWWFWQSIDESHGPLTASSPKVLLKSEKDSTKRDNVFAKIDVHRIFRIKEDLNTRTCTNRMYPKNLKRNCKFRFCNFSSSFAFRYGNPAEGFNMNKSFTFFHTRNLTQNLVLFGALGRINHYEQSRDAELRKIARLSNTCAHTSPRILISPRTRPIAEQTNANTHTNDHVRWLQNARGDFLSGAY